MSLVVGEDNQVPLREVLEIDLGVMKDRKMFAKLLFYESHQATLVHDALQLVHISVLCFVKHKGQWTSQKKALRRYY